MEPARAGPQAAVPTEKFQRLHEGPARLGARARRSPPAKGLAVPLLPSPVALWRGQMKKAASPPFIIKSSRDFAEHLDSKLLTKLYLKFEHLQIEALQTL